jgi:hypothetical protein
MINRDEIDPQGAIIRQTAEAGVAISEELTDLNPNIEIDAKEFGEHVRNGGWRLGLLVARNVELDSGTGERTDLGQNRPRLKISSRAFARQADNISKNTVTKYLNAWNLAAADGHVPSSSALSPGQEVDFSLTDEDGELILTPKLWDSYFKPKGDENDTTVFDFFKGLKKYNECNLRDWLKAENFEGQSDFCPQDVYDLLRGANRISAEAMQIMVELAEPLDLKVISESE